MMNRVRESIRSVLMDSRGALHSEDYVKVRLEKFADQVDDQIQNQLMSDLMVKYSEISRHLEEQNRLLVRSEASLLEAEKIAVLCHWALNMSTRSILWSETINQILERGSSPAPDYEGYMKMIHPDDLGMVRHAHQLLLETVEPRERRYRLLMADGRIKWVHVRSTTFDSGENSSWSHGTIQDITDMKVIEEKLQKYSNHLEEIVNEKVQEISESQMATIFALVKLSESRDDDTGAHIERTSSYCRLIAERLRMLPHYEDILNNAFVNNIYKASPLHDIGKVGIPDAILLKPGKLTPPEFEIMKTHAMLGFETLSHVQKRYTQNTFLKIGMEIAKSHHEKWDGTGYPHGLSGEEIPLSARIMALADVYDALRSKRVYKDAFSHEESCAIIEEGSGNHFDPLLIKIFHENSKAFQEIHNIHMREL